MGRRDDDSSDTRADAETTEDDDGDAAEPSFGTPLGDNAGVYVSLEERAESNEDPGDASTTREASHRDEGEVDPSSTSGDPSTIDFAGFIMSLRANCMINLGHLEHPELGQTVQNLPAARQTIDILKMLDDKTRGNLDRDERNLLKSLIEDVEQAYEDALASQPS